VYLKRLELLGFKSFPDKTVVKLIPGVTSVVGPNGCGKTNILDAIRWVLGEQKVSLLRGAKMEEIIFNGTHDVKPLGMAEVTLVIQNNKGVLPTEYSEVQVTRRLFRSGESEYLLNKVPCRLKDIIDLFMDTGVGAHIYSVIQQDMIDAILSDRTDDRRFLFEEASGISKYKSRKKAAIRKLEATDADLVRLNDIVSEVNTQVNSLNRQMRKARRYKEFSDELKGWELFLSKNAIDELSHEYRELSNQREMLADNKVKSETDIDIISASQETERKKLIDLEKQLAEISNDIFRKSEEAHTVEREISVLNERRDNARQLREKNVLDIEAYAIRKENLLEQIGQHQREMTSIDEALSRLENEIKEKEEALTAVDEKILEARREREKINQKLMALEGRLSAGQSDDNNLREQENEIGSGMSTLDERIGELNLEHESLLGKKTDCEIKLAELENKINETKSKKSTLENDLSALDEQYDEISGKIYELSSSLEAAQARNHLLKQMVAQFEGYGSGVVSAMESRERWPGLIGTVADNLTPQSGHEQPIEAALGERAGFMICRERATADEIIDYLKGEVKGKAGLVILECAGPDPLSIRPQITDEGFIGWADDFVSVSDELQTLASLLLATVAIVKPESVNDILDQLPSYYSAVTTDGRMFRGRAIISGGSREGLSLLGRKEKVAEQEKTIAELNSKAEELRKQKNNITTSIGASQAEHKSMISELDNLKDDLESIEKELTANDFGRQSTRKEIERLEKERGELLIKLDALRTRQYSLNLNHEELAKEKETIVNSLNEQGALIENLENDSENIEKLVSSLQIKRVELKSKFQQLESQIRHTRELINEIDTNTTRKSEENRQADSEIEGSAEKNIFLERRLREIFDQRDAVSENQKKIQEMHDSTRESLDAREKEIKQLRQSREEINSKLHTAEIRNTEIEAETRNIRKKIRDEYDVNLEDIAVAAPNPEIPLEKRPERMLHLRERMKDFGAVNLLALEEYRVTKERQEFLTSQMNDLMSAKATLQSTIIKINQTARRLFMETFAKVRSNFQEVFAELFTGGESDIRLLDENDPLESPIEIIARPRGKRLLSITQMSGGERALTAISLLFAIYLVKPSPFCILDEIDAPLDDANIHRFLKIIKTFSDQTQFIIITHNKITMEAADILYGITMEQPGVSRVVSVRFNEPGAEKLINTSISDIEPIAPAKIPEAIKERITPQVNIKPADGKE